MRIILVALAVVLSLVVVPVLPVLAADPSLVVSVITLAEDDDHFVLPGTACTVLEGAIGNSGGVDNFGGIFLLVQCPSISKHTRLVETSQMLVTANKVTVAPSFSVVVPHQP